MPIHKYEPCALLRGCIQLFWYRCNYNGAAPAGLKEAILPDGCAHLVINLSENKVHLFEQIDDDRITTLSGSVFCGPRSSPYAVLLTASAVIGVLFRPGGAFPFLSMPAKEFHNAQLPSELVFGARAAEVRGRLIAATTVREKFALLEMFLVRHLRSSLPLHRAVAYAVRVFENEPSQTVSDMLARIGLSERRFSSVFSEQVGLTPKLFHRVQRFQKAITALALKREIDWARMAQEAGYYDQAHLIHEFRAFSSITPGAFFARRIVQRNHLPLPA